MATYFWVGGDGAWDNSNMLNWSLLSGGVPGAGPPNSADTATFDSSSGAGICTTAATAAASVIVMNSPSLTLAFGANMVIDNLLALTLGAIDLAGFTLTCLGINSNNTNTRSIAFGTGKIVCTGTFGVAVNNATGFSYTGTPRVEFTYAGGSSISWRFGSSGGGSEANAISGYFASGATVNGAGVALNWDTTGFTGTLISSLTIYGDFTLGAATSYTASGTALVFASTSGTPRVLTSNGVAMDCPITMAGTGGTIRLGGALTIGSTRALTLSAGTFDAQNFSVSLGTFASTGSTARTLALGSGIWTVAGSGSTAWNCTGSNLTVTASAGTISMTSVSAKTFVGLAKSWPTLNQGGAGDLTITGANTFTDINNSVNGTTINLPAGVTTTVGAMSLHGASGSLTTLQSSSSGSAATISKASGSVTASYLSIKDSTATGGAAFRAPINAGNVNVSGNTGWVFNAVSSTGGRAAMGITMSMAL